MPKHMRRLMPVLSILVVITSLWMTQVNVVAQAPTKTPIGEPPTKTPLPIEPPTKTPLPTDPATKTAAPTQTPTLTPRATATATTTRTPTLRASATASPVTVTRASASTVSAVAVEPTSASASVTPNAASNSLAVVSDASATPSASSLAVAIENADPPADTAPTALPIMTQTMIIGGFIFAVISLGLLIWFGLARLGRAITTEIRTVSLANLRLQHEAERLGRREKVAFRADSDVLSLLEQAILDASGESVHVRLLQNGWVSSPPMLAVVNAEQTRYIFSPTPPDQVRDIARRHGLTQLLLGRATDLTAYPIDGLNSTPFIVDDLSAAYAYVLARHQAPRRPLPRTDRWYLYIASPRPTHWTARFERRMKQTGVLRRFTDRLHSAPDPTPSPSTAERTSTPSGPPPRSGGHGQPGD